MNSIDLPTGAVISIELFEEVQRTVAKVAETKNRNREGKRIYPLTGLLEYEDGTKFSGLAGTGRNGDVHYYYWCVAPRYLMGFTTLIAFRSVSSGYFCSPRGASVVKPTGCLPAANSNPLKRLESPALAALSLRPYLEEKLITHVIHLHPVL